MYTSYLLWQARCATIWQLLALFPFLFFLISLLFFSSCSKLTARYAALGQDTQQVLQPASGENGEERRWECLDPESCLISPSSLWHLLSVCLKKQGKTQQNKSLDRAVCWQKWMCCFQKCVWLWDKVGRTVQLRVNSNIPAGCPHINKRKLAIRLEEQ